MPPLSDDAFSALCRLIAAADHPTWRARHKALLHSLAVSVGEGQARPRVSLPQLAAWCRVSLALTLRTVADLEACGVLVVVLRESAPRRRALWPVVYRLDLDTLAALRRHDA